MRDKSPETLRHSELKAKISSPIEAGRSTLPSLSKGKLVRDERAWRESVLNQVVSLSLSRNFNKLDEAPELEKPRMVSSGSKSRLAIPDRLLQSAEVQDRPDSEHFGGIGEAMLKAGYSMGSGLSLRPTKVENVVMRKDAPSAPAIAGRTLKEIGKEESMASASV